MCHCFESLADLPAEEREEVLAEHDVDELRAEYPEEELATLGVDA